MAGQMPGYFTGTTLTSIINSGNPPPGSVGTAAIASGAVGTNQIQSGAVGPVNLASGLFTFVLAPCVEAISGTLAPVAIVSGSFAAKAQNGSGLRMPAIGVAVSGNISGATVMIVTGGLIQTGFASGWSGFAGVPLYTGSGGNTVTLSGFGFSGMGVQMLGVAISGGMNVEPSLLVLSGLIGVYSGTGALGF